MSYTSNDFIMNASQKNVRKYHLAIRRGEFVKNLPFEKNSSSLRYLSNVRGVTAPVIP